MTTKKDELALVEQETAVTQAPRTTGRGFENVDLETITMPRGKLLQSNSPEVADRDYNMRAGDIIHTLLMEKVPEKFIPLSIFDTNIMFVPRTEERKAAMKAKLGLSDEDMAGQIVCRADDGKHGTRYGSCVECGLCKFNGNEKPWCNATINVLADPVNEDKLDMPVVYQFANTSYKHGKKFRDTAFYASLGQDLFSRIYKLESFLAQAAGNSWFEMRVKPAGLVSSELYPAVEAQYNAFANKNIIVDAEEDAPITSDKPSY
jgi:hypothetical protein